MRINEQSVNYLDEMVEYLEEVQHASCAMPKGQTIINHATVATMMIRMRYQKERRNVMIVADKIGCIVPVKGLFAVWINNSEFISKYRVTPKAGPYAWCDYGNAIAIPGYEELAALIDPEFFNVDEFRTYLYDNEFVTRDAWVEALTNAAKGTK